MSAPHGSSGRSRVAGNTAALMLLQATNYGLPLLLLPYLTRVLGLEGYGVVAFGLAIVQLAFVVTDYGFGLSATYRIARRRDDPAWLNGLASRVLGCKLLLVAAVGLLLAAGLALDTRHADQRPFFALLMLSVLGQALQPVWLFQGLERMGWITVYSVLGKALYVLLVLLSVHSMADLAWVAVAHGVAQCVAAAVGLGLAWRLGLRLHRPGWAAIGAEFRHSAAYFWSRAAVSTYAAGGAVFLGLVSGPAQVALYAAAEQLYKAAQGLVMPLSQALFPHMARRRDDALFARLLLATAAGAALGLAAAAWGGPALLTALFGAAFAPAQPVLMVFAGVFCLSAPALLLGYPYLGALGRIDLANRSVFLAGALQLLLLAACWRLGWTTAVDVALAVLFAEAVVLAYRGGWAWRLRPARGEAGDAVPARPAPLGLCKKEECNAR